jgi:hypothetical protein
LGEAHNVIAAIDLPVQHVLIEIGTESQDTSHTAGKNCMKGSNLQHQDTYITVMNTNPLCPTLK